MIPKKIHYCWFGGNPLPELAIKCIESWKKFCPDYEIIEWNETNYDIKKNKYMYEAYQLKKWGFVPDYARLDIIHTHGGIYLDTDVEIIKSFDGLLNQKGFCGVEKGSKYIAFGLGFGAEKNDPTIKLLLDYYNDLSFIKNGSPDLTPAPVINHNAIKDLYQYDEHEITTCGTLTVYPSSYFCPQGFVTGELEITDDTYSIHHYSASWYGETAKRSYELRKFFSKYLPRRTSAILGTAFAKLEKEGIKSLVKWILPKLKRRKNL